MLEEEELKDAILLVFANKQDSKGAMNAQQVGIPSLHTSLVIVCVCVCLCVCFYFHRLVGSLVR